MGRYVYVEARVNLDEIESQDLVDELRFRFLRSTPTVVEVRGFFNELAENFDYDLPVLENLGDKEKFEHLMKVFEKYSLIQIEAALPV